MTEEQKKNMTKEEFEQFRQELHAKAQEKFAEEQAKQRRLNIEQLEELKKTLKEADEKNSTLKILNQAKEDAEKKYPGMEVQATVKVDPETGETSVVHAHIPDEEEASSIGDFGDEDNDTTPLEENTSNTDYGNEEDTLPDLDEIEFDESAAEEERENFERSVEITADDIKDIASETSDGEFKISTETASDILSIIDSIRNGVNNIDNITYKMMPDQLKEYIDRNIKSSSIANGPINTTMYNTYRNSLAKTIVSHYMDNITSSKYLDDISKKISELYDTSTIKMSPVLKKFNSAHLERLQALYDKTENEEDKTRIKECIDSIEDAYNLTRLKEMKPIKLKSFELEQPQKVYRSIIYQYIKCDNEHAFYDFEVCEKVLQRHLENKGLAKSDKDASKFLLLFSKFCDKNNYKVQNQQEHLFMYFVSYNIVLLDAYKEEDYEEFAAPFLDNIVYVIDHCIKNKK